MVIIVVEFVFFINTIFIFINKIEIDGGKRSAGGLEQEHDLSHDGIKCRSIFQDTCPTQ